MLIDSYTVSSVKDLSLLPFLKRAQFTLNPRLSPSKRNVVKSIHSLKVTPSEIYIHYDYLRTIPRYGFMSDYNKKLMIEELVNIFEYSCVNHSIKGVILHMDTAINKQMFEYLKSFDKITSDVLTNMCQQFITSTMYKSKEDCAAYCHYVWNTSLPYDEKQPDYQIFLHKFYVVSYTTFIADFTSAFIRRGYSHEALRKMLSDKHCLLYLENTTKVNKFSYGSFAIPGSIMHNVMLASNNPNLVGVCWDMEHSFASGDIELNDKTLTKVYSVCPNILIHLNAIEKGVDFGSFKDRHSLTTVFECSHYPFEFYSQLIDYLNQSNIPYIREVKSETMNRELQQVKDYNLATTDA